MNRTPTALYADLLPQPSSESDNGAPDAATTVLHDVGNLVNSVGVSMEMLRRDWAEPRALGALRSFLTNAKRQPDLIRQTVEAGPERLVTYLTAILNQLEASHAGMDQQIGQMAGTLDDVRTIIRAQQGSARDAMCAGLVDLGQVVDDVVDLHAEDSFDRQTTLRRRGLPSLALTADRTRVLRIVSNLVSNAIDAVSDEPIAQRVVEVRLAMADDGARICVMDRGMGIDPEHAASIFTHGFSTKVDGHGFGLAGCAQSAREMGGALRFHSDGPGTGTTFSLCLPWRR